MPTHTRMPAGVCKKMANPPKPPMLEVHTPMTSAMSVGASLPVLASPRVVTAAMRPPSFPISTMRWVTKNTSPFSSVSRKVTICPTVRSCFSSSSNRSTRMSAPPAKLSSSSPFIESVMTARGAVPKISGGTSGLMLLLMMSVRLTIRMGSRMTVSTASTAMPTILFTLSFFSIVFPPPRRAAVQMPKTPRKPRRGVVFHSERSARVRTGAHPRSPAAVRLPLVFYAY